MCTVRPNPPHTALMCIVFGQYPIDIGECSTCSARQGCEYGVCGTFRRFTPHFFWILGVFGQTTALGSELCTTPLSQLWMLLFSDALLARIFHCVYQCERMFGLEYSPVYKACPLTPLLPSTTSSIGF